MTNTPSTLVKTLIQLALVLVLVHFANVIFIQTGLAPDLRQFGVRPGNISNLPFVFSAPFIHGNWFHLWSNLPILLILSTLTLLRGKRYFLYNSFTIILVSGVLVWFFARPGTHIGASGWVFGLWSLIISRALFEKSLWNIVIALAVVFFYGGMVFGLLPTSKYISFEAHIGGAVAGFFCAYFGIARNRYRRVR